MSFFLPAWILPPQTIEDIPTSRKHRPVRICGRVFPSVNAAAMYLACSESHIRTLVYRGKAEYINDKN